MGEKKKTAKEIIPTTASDAARKVELAEVRIELAILKYELGSEQYITEKEAQKKLRL